MIWEISRLEECQEHTVSSRGNSLSSKLACLLRALKGFCSQQPVSWTHSLRFHLDSERTLESEGTWGVSGKSGQLGGLHNHPNRYEL